MLEVYKSLMLTVIAVLMFFLVKYQGHTHIDGGEIEVTNEVQITSDEPLEVKATEPIDVSIANQDDVLEVEIEK
jgi:hypothetical protein